MEGEQNMGSLLQVSFQGLQFAFTATLQAAELAFKFIQYLANLPKYHQTKGLTSLEELSESCGGNVKVFSMKKDQYELLSKNLTENGVLFSEAPSLVDDNTVNFFVGAKDLAIVQQCMDDLQKRFINEAVKSGKFSNESEAADAFMNDNRNLDFNEYLNKEFAPLSKDEFSSRMAKQFGSDWLKDISSYELKKDEKGNFMLRNEEIDALAAKTKLNIGDSNADSRYVMQFAEDEYKMDFLKKHGTDTSKLSPSDIKSHIRMQTDDYVLVQLSSFSPIGAWIPKDDIVSMRASTSNPLVSKEQGVYKDFMNTIIFNKNEKIKVCNINKPEDVHEFPITKPETHDPSSEVFSFSEFKNMHDKMLRSYFKEDEKSMKEHIKEFYYNNNYKDIMYYLKDITGFYQDKANNSNENLSAEDYKNADMEKNQKSYNSEQFEKIFNDNLANNFLNSYKR